MKTLTLIPEFPLNLFIDYFFYYSGFNAEHEMDRLIPDGNVQLIFELADYPQYIYDNFTLKKIQSCKNVWFAGIRTEPITIPSGRDSEMIIVQFRKGKASPFLSEPLHALTNSVVDAEMVLKNDILSLRDQLCVLPDPGQKLRFLQCSLVDFFESHLQENPYVDYVISRLQICPDYTNLQRISEKTGYSQKHVIKIFKDCVGITPKEFLKISRFQKAIVEIEQAGIPNWVKVALDCGYYDQSHFIADFKSFSGYTPVSYMMRRGQYLNYLPVSDQR